MASPTLEFGPKDPGADYKDRPAAVGLALKGDHLAVVRVTKPGQPPWLDLPGGAVDPGETEDEAVVREFGEETGLVVRPGVELERAAQYFFSEGRPFRNVGPLMIVDVTGEDPDLKIEADHELVWIDPAEAIGRLRHDSHAWAVACLVRARLSRPDPRP